MSAMDGRTGRAVPAPVTGALLMADPSLHDPNFERTVVLLLDVDAHGALGVVLNRPTPVPVSDLLDARPPSVAQPEVLFRGGPVGPDEALGVALRRGGAGHPGFRGLRGPTDRLGVVDLDLPSSDLDDAAACVRVFAGYAGWGAGQLQREIAEGSWHVVDSLLPDAFLADPARLWHDVWRRQPGELAWLSTFPDDPVLN